MNGAREYAQLFKSGQHGRLYFVSSSHGRGKTFRIFVLPEGVLAQPNAGINAPLNVDAVEVYGAIGGQPGWSEFYGWLHRGKWEADFAQLVERRKAEIARMEAERANTKQSVEQERAQRVQALLAAY